MAAINADPEVMRRIGDGAPIDEEATAAGTRRVDRGDMPGEDASGIGVDDERDIAHPGPPGT